jgi:hypothetical protein
VSGAALQTACWLGVVFSQTCYISVDLSGRRRAMTSEFWHNSYSSDSCVYSEGSRTLERYKSGRSLTEVWKNVPYVIHCLRVQRPTEGVIMLLQSWRMNPGAMEMCGYKMTSVHYCPAHDPLQSHQRSPALQPQPSCSLLHGSFAASRLLFIKRRSETHKSNILINIQVWTTSMV